MRILILVAALLMLATLGSAQTGRAIADLYPADEHCVFVPPPIWQEVNPGDARFGATLLLDRSLALRVRDQLAERQRHLVATLAPDFGMQPGDLERGGEGLRRALAFTFERYAESWARIRAQTLSADSRYDLASFAAMQAACPRRAVLAVTETAPGEARAVVISLITGNVLARQDWRY